MTSPMVHISIERRTIERLLPGAIAEAEDLAQDFTDDERDSWIAGRLGLLLSTHFSECGPPLADTIAERVLDLLDERAALASSRLVSAGELAKLLGRSREWVYDHADDLGGRRIGTGERPRLWFDPDRAVNGRQTSEGSRQSESPTPPGGSRPRRRQDTASQAPSLPIGGRRERRGSQ